MPFIIFSQNKSAQLGIVTTPIKWEDLKRYRSKFEARVKSVWNTNKKDHSTDLRPITMKSEVLAALVEHASEDHYLVAQYICDPEDKLYTNLDIALCIKQRRGNGPNDDKIVNGHIIDRAGKPIPMADFEQLTKNYKNRRDEIIHSGQTTEFHLDREGRAHQTTFPLKTVVKLLQAATKDLHLYFILDDETPENETTLSVVVVDRDVNFEKDTLSDPIAYDHGTQCCPIK